MLAWWWFVFRKGGGANKYLALDFEAFFCLVCTSHRKQSGCGGPPCHHLRCPMSKERGREREQKKEKFVIRKQKKRKTKAFLAQV
jgi:hypothetical protein